MALDRSTVDLYKHPDFKTLFPDPHAEGVRFYRKTGIYPINHGMVIKREIAEKHPWTVAHIYKAFEKALALAEKARKEAVEYHLETGLLPPEARKALATPIVQYGIEANRKVLEDLIQTALSQRIITKPVAVEDLFVPSTRNLKG